MVTCPTYPEKFIRDNFVAPFVPTSVVILTPPVVKVWNACPVYPVDFGQVAEFYHSIKTIKGDLSGSQQFLN